MHSHEGFGAAGDIAALIDAGGARESDPEFGVRLLDIDGDRREEADSERRLDHQQDAGEGDREDRRREAAPFVQDGFAGQRDHDWRNDGGAWS
ncbi:hypothetical protein [Sphingomonas koreensis]|uniref:hypothetical protein n=1 Tax=Sphingomonas koreensis TaxID=93064 RepID=UPI000F7DE655|nr:hypothetical protein [Sphingomonas koreensis]